MIFYILLIVVINVFKLVNFLFIDNSAFQGEGGVNDQSISS